MAIKPAEIKLITPAKCKEPLAIMLISPETRTKIEIDRTRKTAETDKKVAADKRTEVSAKRTEAASVADESQQEKLIKKAENLEQEAETLEKKAERLEEEANLMEKGIEVPFKHTEGESKCPFCQGKVVEPKKESDFSPKGKLVDCEWKRNDFIDNDKASKWDSDKEIKQAKEKIELTIQQTDDIKKKESLANQLPPYGSYSPQAHHLISKAKAKESEFGVNSAKNTGYSIHNSKNGILLPSFPQKFDSKKKTEKGFVMNWGDLPNEIKRDAAFRVMSATGVQCHISNHQVTIEDLENDTSYEDEVERQLEARSKNFQKWGKECPKKEGEKINNDGVNEILHSLSVYLKSKITAPPCEWDVFLSSYALEFHNALSHTQTPNQPESTDTNISL
jgi:hypothetical protein